jgi:hypothetical protein
MRISKIKQDKISEQILAFLFSKSPKPIFTSHIALELARDEEFIKKLLLDLKNKKLVSEVAKNPQGKIYLRRKRWKLSEEAYKAYKYNQNNF